jgi:hypothetical protein
MEHTDKALMEACKKTNAIATEYTVGPVVCTETELGAYERVIEFSKDPADIQEFTHVLDQELQRAFSNYYDERNYNKTLKQLIVHQAPQGTFYRRLKSHNRIGGQFKVPKLYNNREILDELIPLADENISK